MNSDFKYHKWQAISETERRCLLCGRTQTLQDCGRMMGRQWWPISGECLSNKAACGDHILGALTETCANCFAAVAFRRY